MRILALCTGTQEASQAVALTPGSDTVQLETGLAINYYHGPCHSASDFSTAGSGGHP